MASDLAVVLLAHGARDPGWALPLYRLQDEMHLLYPAMRTQIAFLEVQLPNLPDVLAALACDGVQAIQVAPIFWSRGAHIEKDLPAIIDSFVGDHPGVCVRVAPVLSQLAGMTQFIVHAIASAAMRPPSPST